MRINWRNNMKKLLVVDDEVGICGFIEEYFSLRNFDVDVAHNGLDAMKFFENNKRPDVVLLDIRMPVMDGFQMFNRIKDGKPKVIFTTAYTDQNNTKEKLLAQGAYAYIEKPITDLKSLEKIVNEAVESLEEDNGKAFSS